MKIKFISNQEGQTAFEYIVLIAIVVSVAMVFLRSPFISGLISVDGDVLSTLRKKMEHSYRNGFHKTNSNFEVPNYNGFTHESYYGNGSSRFFTAKDKYPGN